MRQLPQTNKQKQIVSYILTNINGFNNSSLKLLRRILIKTVLLRSCFLILDSSHRSSYNGYNIPNTVHRIHPLSIFSVLFNNFRQKGNTLWVYLTFARDAHVYKHHNYSTSMKFSSSLRYLMF